MASLDFFRVQCECNKCTGVVMCADRNLLPTVVKPINYKLLLHPDLDKLTFTGHVDIKVDCLESCTVIALHCFEIQIQTALFSVEGGEAKPCSIGNYDAEEQTVSITLPDTFTASAKGELSIDFTGILNDQACEHCHMCHLCLLSL